ncbi:MAG: hypothetical protein Kow0042_14400 [Calditrichia bacterium]
MQVAADLNRSDYRNLVILLGIVLLVRFWGITYGLPSVYNSTEYFIAKHALSFGARKTLEPLFFVYPTFFSYLIATVFAAYFIIGKIVGIFPTAADFAFQFLADPSSFYLIGRTVSAAALILACLIFYRTCRFFGSPLYSLVVALLMVFSFNLHFFGFWMTPDALLILGTTLTLYVFVRAYFRGLTLRGLLLGSIICGLTISTKYNAGFLAMGWLAAVGMLPGSTFKVRIRNMGLAGLLILLGFLIGTPYWLFKFSRFWEGFRTIWSQSLYAYNVETGVPYLWEIQKLITSEWLLGIMLLVLMLTLFLRMTRFTLPVAAIILPTFLLVGSWEKKGLDYLLVIFPPLFILLAYRIYQMGEVLRKFKWGLGVLFLALALNIPRVLYQNYLHTCRDTRAEAGRWVMENVSPGSPICYDHYHYDIDLIDVNRYLEYGAGSRFLSPAVREKVEKLQRAPNNYPLISSQKNLDSPSVPPQLARQMKDDPFLWEKLTHPHKTLKELLAEGIQVLIVNSESYEKYLENPPPSPSNPLRSDFLTRRNFYEHLFSAFNPVVVFQPGWSRPGPVIQIFDFRKER